MRVNGLHLLAVLSFWGCASATRDPASAASASGGAGSATPAESATAAGATDQGTAPAATAADQDGDGTPDADDACPTERGAASPERRSNGCPKKPVADQPPEGLLIRPIEYAAGASEFARRQDLSQLDEVAKLMQNSQKRCLLVEGYTDSKTEPKPGLQLSLARARSVQRYLLVRGVPQERVALSGPGSVCERTPGEASNRRVIVRVLDCPLPASAPEPDCTKDFGWFPYEAVPR
jgi:outer membrane protein OmpA-like peptidoglycan-associated protein